MMPLESKTMAMRTTIALQLATIVLALSVASGFQPPQRVTRQQQPMTTLNAVELAGAATAVDSFFTTQPYMSAFLACSFKASAADLVAQVRAANEDEAEEVEVLPQVQDSDEVGEVDFSRNLAFIAYGGLYQGLFQEFLFNVLYPSWFGADPSWQTIAKTVCFDNAVTAPLLCLPMAYAVKSIFTNTEPDLTLDETVEKGMEKYVEDLTERGILTKYWSLWIPVSCLTFSVIPHQFRIAFVALVSFFWVLILSTVSASTTTAAEASPTKLIGAPSRQ